MADIRAPQMAVEFGDQFESSFTIFERRLRRPEVARIRETVGADRSQVR